MNVYGDQFFICMRYNTHTKAEIEQFRSNEHEFRLLFSQPSAIIRLNHNYRLISIHFSIVSPHQPIILIIIGTVVFAIISEFIFATFGYIKPNQSDDMND